MKCERCLKGKEAQYRVHTDLIDMKVCAACAEEAGRLGIAVEGLDRRPDKDNQGKSEFGVQGWRVKLSA
jgi:ribosome-binding protein aMBF1 (putative translation factor)